jgi:hypothetical protein
MKRSALRRLCWVSLLLLDWAVASSVSSEPRAVEEPRGTTYYVDSESGSDANDGTSPESAFRTLKHAAAALDRSGGDTLVVRGTFRETLNLVGINDPQQEGPDRGRPTVIRCAVDGGGGAVCHDILDFSARVVDSIAGQLWSPGPASLYASIGWQDRQIDPPKWATQTRWTGTVDGGHRRRSLSAD